MLSDVRKYVADLYFLIHSIQEASVYRWKSAERQSHNPRDQQRYGDLGRLSPKAPFALAMSTKKQALITSYSSCSSLKGRVLSTQQNGKSSTLSPPSSSSNSRRAKANQNNQSIIIPPLQILKSEPKKRAKMAKETPSGEKETERSFTYLLRRAPAGVKHTSCPLEALASNRSLTRAGSMKPLPTRP